MFWGKNKKKVYPCKPQFYYIKVGCKGVFVTRTCFRDKEAVPQKFKDASIIYLYKRKENPTVCYNHRDTSLLLIAGNILAKNPIKSPECAS